MYYSLRNEVFFIKFSFSYYLTVKTKYYFCSLTPSFLIESYLRIKKGLCIMERHEIEYVVPSLFMLITGYFFFIRKEMLYGTEIEKGFFLSGLVICFLGFIIWWWGKVTIGNAFHPLPRAKKVVSHGIYSKIRHPIYTGLSFVLVGLSVLFSHWFITFLCGFTIAIQIVRARREEAILIEKFGEKYIEYKKKTIF